MDRTLIKSGPAIFIWNGATIYFRDGLTIEEETPTVKVEADIFAGSDNRRDTPRTVFTGNPSGQWKNLDVLFPYLAPKPGTRMHGTSDKAAVAWFLDGDKFTYHNVGLAKMPELTFSTVKTLLGGVEFHGRTKNNTLASAANSMYTRTNVPFDDSSFDWADIPTLPYTLNFGASPWDDFDTEDGVVITPTLSWGDIISDKAGVVDEEITALEVVASFTPVGIAQSAIDAKMNTQGTASAVRGARMSAVGSDFILSGTGVYAALRNASLRKAQIRAGRRVNRTGKLEAVASLQMITGAEVAQLYLGTEEPV